jgi:hypothetical protein
MDFLSKKEKVMLWKNCDRQEIQSYIEHYTADDVMDILIMVAKHIPEYQYRDWSKGQNDAGIFWDRRKNGLAYGDAFWWARWILLGVFPEPNGTSLYKELDPIFPKQHSAFINGLQSLFEGNVGLYNCWALKHNFVMLPEDLYLAPASSGKATFLEISEKARDWVFAEITTTLPVSPSI